MKTICLGNQKGGVAKTTNALNIAYTLANNPKFNYRVLVIDMDSQASATFAVGIDSGEDDDYMTISDLLAPLVNGHPEIVTMDYIRSAIKTPTYTKPQRVDGAWTRVTVPFGFDLIPSSLDLANLEMTLWMKGTINKGDGKKFYVHFLKTLVDMIDKADLYDFCIIDTPPAIGSLTLNSIAAARNGVIIPTNMDLMAYHGIKPYIQTVGAIQKMYPGHFGVIGILRSCYAERRVLDKKLSDYAVEFFPLPIFKTEIPESVEAKTATINKRMFCQINKKAELAYEKICQEMLDYMKLTPTVLSEMDIYN